MRCPNDNKEMHQVRAASHYGQTVALDQCPDCGGIWFDYFELYQVAHGESEKIEQINAAAFVTLTPLKNIQLCCPKDKAKLINFKDPGFPKEIIVARCPECKGFWLNRGELIKYDKYRRSFNQPQLITEEDVKIGKQMMQIMAEQKKDYSTEAMMKLGKFLSIPLDSLGRPLEPEKITPGEQRAINTIFSLLFTVLRLFLRI